MNGLQMSTQRSSFVDFLKEGFAANGTKPAVCWNDQSFSYGWLLESMSELRVSLDNLDVCSGEVVAIEGDFTPQTIALFLALIERGCIVVPHNASNVQERTYRFETAGVGRWFAFNERDESETGIVASTSSHALYDELRKREHPGLVLFTSGSSGKPKAAVHDLLPLLEKFHERRPALKTLNFLLFDHWGGLNTMFHTLSNGGVIIPVYNRNAEAVCALIEEHGIELLPASPTFLNLLLLSGAHLRHNLSSLQTITYGTEPMPLSTLERLRVAFPAVRLHQTYGLIELGVLRSKSRDDGSLWVKVGGAGYDTRVVDSLLQIKAQSAMLGYLNAPSPFTEDGWFMTGDQVETDGEFIRILGRKSEMINVGGDKVAPSEIENVIQELDNVAEVMVFGEKHPLVGNIVCANVTLLVPEDAKAFTRRLRQFCGERMQKYKVPVKVNLVTTTQHTHRFKKARVQHPAQQSSIGGQVVADSHEQLHQQFRDEVRDNISGLRGDGGLQARSRDWIRDTSAHKYTYNFSWMGRPIIQFPQDMMAMQEILWAVKPDLVIEAGVAHGGSIVYYASLLELMGHGEVVGIDIDIRAHNREAIEAHPMAKRIRLIEGSSIADDTIRQVQQIAQGKRVVVVLDSNHTHEHVLAELRAYAPLVCVGGYCVVMDTVVEDMPKSMFPNRPWGPGDNPKTAVHEYLRETNAFEIDGDIDAKLLISVAPSGYLRRVR